MYRNVGGRFEDAPASLGPGFDVVETSRGLAEADYDNDGVQDILLEITWPDGSVQEIADVPADQCLRIEQAAPR